MLICFLAPVFPKHGAKFLLFSFLRALRMRFGLCLGHMKICDTIGIE